MRWCADHSGFGALSFAAASAAAADIAETTETRAATSSGVGSPLTIRSSGGGPGLVGHSGMFPCFFGGSVSRLEASRRSARTTSMRVSCGVMTASM